MRTALRALPGVQRAEVYGSGDEALWVQTDLAALRRYRVPVTALVKALKDQVLLAPAGYLTQGHQDILLEARHLPSRAAELERIPVAGPSGPVPLGALAQVVRAPLPTHNAVSLDGRPSIALTIFKQPGASTVPVTRAVERTLAETLDQLPSGVHWVRTYDQGYLVGLIGRDLGRNLLIGAGLAIASLFWILGAGRGIWALALSIPLSLLMGVAGLYALGQSLDLMTLGALTVAVGLLADDAVIVPESICHRWESGAEQWEGIRQGVADIASPDVTGTLTVVAVFAPLLFVGGLAGLFFIPFALAMTVALLASLFISLSLVPLGLGFLSARPRTRPTVAARALEILATPTGTLGGTIRAARRALASLSLPAGYRIGFGGLYPELEKAALGLGVASLAAFLLMAGILVLQFDGWLIPGLLLLQIPLASTGGAAALAVSGVGLNATGLVAFLTLVGISLNHGIVLLYRARRNEAAGMDVEAAVREAVHVRFRPIFLTTLTAVLGMLPTALGWGEGAAPEQGLAVVILGGILWSALLSTNLIPALYVRRRTRRLPQPAATPRP